MIRRRASAANMEISKYLAGENRADTLPTRIAASEPRIRHCNLATSDEVDGSRVTVVAVSIHPHKETYMRNLRKAQWMGVGVLTPALMGHPQAAEAGPTGFTKSVAATNASTVPSAEAKQLFFRAVFAVSPAEKLRIAGDRIRLSATQIAQKQGSAGVNCATSKFVCAVGKIVVCGAQRKRNGAVAQEPTRFACVPLTINMGCLQAPTYACVKSP
jgi:hypothetical protein